MTEEKRISEFLEALSSKQPVPGGGGASALGGAIGAALGEMVANLTIGKKKYADVEEEIRKVLGQMEILQKEFIRLSDEDEKVFAPLAASYGLPAGTEEERSKKEEILEKNLLAASLVPIHVMENTLKAMELLEVLAQKGSRMAISDVGVGIQFIRAALLGAVMNVYINTKSMKDKEVARELNSRAQRLVEEGAEKADAIYKVVLQKIS